MKKLGLIIGVTATLIVVVFALLVQPTTPAHAEVMKNGQELSMYMDHLRMQAHKLGLSIDAKNKDLTSFYTTEIKELAELMKKQFPTYDGVQVSALLGAMLTPQVAQLEAAVAKGDWVAINTKYDGLIKTGCNACHTATNRAFIKIVRSKTNPYNQSFKP